MRQLELCLGNDTRSSSVDKRDAVNDLYAFGSPGALLVDGHTMPAV